MKKTSTLYFYIFFVLLVVDVLFKYYVSFFIPKMSFSYPFFPYGGIGVFYSLLGGIELSIVHVENLGAAWGMFSAYAAQLFWFRIVIVFCLFFYLVFLNKEKSKNIPMLFILTGAVGNILDFIFYGHVIDMFYFKFWKFSYPIFNIADIFITFGIFLLFFQSLSKKKNVSSKA